MHVISYQWCEFGDKHTKTVEAAKVKMAQNNHHRSAISEAELGKQLLKKQLADLNKNPVEGFSAGLISDSDFFKWEVSIN